MFLVKTMRCRRIQILKAKLSYISSVQEVIYALASACFYVLWVSPEQFGA
jgi:hypothetical protein